MKKQFKIFLETEGNSYFKRNTEINFNKEILYNKIKQLHTKIQFKKILEIGCGDGGRLRLLNENLKIRCFGIEPSTSAIKFSKKKNKNVTIKKGTAQKINFDNNMFDVVVFGFCLYLVDIEDLVKVFIETDRVLKKGGHIFIYDFYSKNSKIFLYKHNKNVKTHKNDFEKIFLWHPNYKSIYKKIFDHGNLNKKGKNPNNWTAISLIKKIS